jgi:hypothetical protein
MTSKQKIDPESMRGKLAGKFFAVIREFRQYRSAMVDAARQQGLTLDQLLAAILTEAALEEIEE